MRLKLDFRRKLISLYLLALTLLLASGVAADQQRLKIQNIKRAIQSQGAQWTAADNEISRMPRTEFRKLLGWLPDEPRVKATPGFEAKAIVGALPDAFDWRNVNGKNYITSIKRQLCGDCWAHSGAAALESRLIIDGNEPMDLSEQLLVSNCSNAGSCSGGYIVPTSQFLVNTGIPEEDCYPYLGDDSDCGQACSNWRNITYQASSYTRIAQDVDSLKSALYTRGPINAGYIVYEDFDAYRDGIYEHSYGNAMGGHAILIVGYDDHDQCFIVKNSWGRRWGEDGYFRIAYSQVYNQVDFGASACVYGDEISHEEDHDPPAPDPMTWNSAPAGISSSAIAMTATGATDQSGVEYYFECTSAGCHDSGWQENATYTDTGLAAETTYTYRVKARDRSVNHNETGWSTEAEASTVSATAGVEIISPFRNGLSHAKPQGTNRLLVFSVHAEDDNTNVRATEVTYGGQPMTLAVEQHVGTGYRAYAALFVLAEEGVAAAENDNFTVTWNEQPARSPGYASAFFSNVNPGSPVSEFDSGSTLGNPLELSALSPQAGEMVLVAGTCGNIGSYDVLNDFNEALELDINSADAVVGYLQANGAPMTPGVTHSIANRQAAVAVVLALAATGDDDQPPSPDPMQWDSPPRTTGADSISMTAATAQDENGVEYFFDCIEGDCQDSGWQESPTYEDSGLTANTSYTYRVQARDLSAAHNTTGWSETASATTNVGAAEVEIIGTWQSGLQHPLSDGADRLLVFTVHAEDDNADVIAETVSFGGQPMEKITETHVATGYRAYIAVFVLNEAGIAAAQGNGFTVDWSQTPYRTPGYTSVCLTNVNQSQAIGDHDSIGGTDASIETAALATSSGDLVIVAGVCGNRGLYTVNNGFVEVGELSIVSADGVVGYKQAGGASETPSVTHSAVNRQALAAIVVQAP